jgi:CheY-like chemotaxis protein/DNA-binding XRE family transcriptional regulator
MDDIVPADSREPDLAALGAFVRERRHSLGLTQTQLGICLGWQQERISLLESGRYGLPSVSALARLAVTLQTTLREVLAAAGFPDDVYDRQASRGSYKDDRSTVRRIVVVDDDPALLDLMGNILEERQWELLAVSDAASAFNVVRDTKPDVVLLDIRLGGGVSGWSVFGELETDPATQGIPVIIWSGDMHDLDGKRDWLKKQGISVLPKPFDINMLFACLDEALQHKHTASSDGAGGGDVDLSAGDATANV